MSRSSRLRSLSISCLLPWLLAASPSSAHPSEESGFWLVGTGQGNLGFLHPGLQQARGWLDVQGRWRDEGESLNAVLVRPGVGHALTDRLAVFAGYAWIETDPAGRRSFNEHRVWQQLTWNLPVEGFSLQSRTRLEQRVVDRELGWRLREFAKLTLPLTSDRRLFLSGYDELFFDLDDTDWGQRAGFRQNRAFAGLGWGLDAERRVTVEVGYLNQWLSRPSRDGVHHLSSLNLFLNF